MKRQPMPGIQMAPTTSSGRNWYKILFFGLLILGAMHLYRMNKKQKDNGGY